jgi:hypothetical protein
LKNAAEASLRRVGVFWKARGRDALNTFETFAI